MNLVIGFWRKRSYWMILLVLYTFVGVTISLLFPYILKDVIDGIKSGFTHARLLKYVALLSGIGLCRGLISVTIPYLRGRTNETFNYRLRIDIFSSIMRKGYSFANRYPTGDVLQRFDQDLGELSWFACSGIFRPIEGIFVIIVTIFFLTRINLFLTVVSVLPMSVAIFAWMRFSPLIYEYYHQWREWISKTHDYLQSSFAGIRIVKSYTMENKNHSQFVKILRTRIETAIRFIKIEAKIITIFSSIEEIGIFAVLLGGSILIIHGHLTIGELVAFYSYITILLGPMRDIGNFFVIRKRAQVQIERLETIKNHPPDVEDLGQKSLLTANNLRLRNVYFRYDNSSVDVLENVNMVIPSGRKIGIAGTVGSGKTTLIKLLIRVAEPTKGSINLDDINIRDLPLVQFRKLFGYVPQEPSLFSDTIHNNITFGCRDLPEQIEKTVRLAQLDQFVNDLPKGLNEVVGERGLKLSGGEKQRVAIARAMLNDPRILVLDDATSNLDAETERELINAIAKAKSTTLILISHRLSILSICDYIYVMDQAQDH